MSLNYNTINSCALLCITLPDRCEFNIDTAICFIAYQYTSFTKINTTQQFEHYIHTIKIAMRHFVALQFRENYNALYFRLLIS